jgi:hypothetical protein
VVFSGANGFAERNGIEAVFSDQMPLSAPHNIAELLVGCHQRDELVRGTKVALAQ